MDLPILVSNLPTSSHKSNTVLTEILWALMSDFYFCFSFNKTWNCARKVSTILCIHAPTCSPSLTCSDHGECVEGVCVCTPPWSGEGCQTLACLNNCSHHGQCVSGKQGFIFLEKKVGVYKIIIYFEEVWIKVSLI